MSIEFEKAFLTGDILIDNEHRKMIEVLNRVNDLSEQGDAAKCKSTLAAFVRVAQRHFQREENIFEKMNYPKRDEHNALHENLLSRAASILAEKNHETGMEIIRKNVEEMMDILVEDIINGDLEFVAFLNKIRKEKSKESDASS